ncbi:MAG TPA: serine/threonine-protein kinase, partial [Candidatus Saccharimonadales bacterium]|nr:serine/threonine-protein kinase [Candidatus Saccharimonadales bacterium]
MSVPISREKAVFDAALEMTDPAQRRLFLDEACAGNAGLRSAVEELLSTQAEAERFFTEGSSSLAELTNELKNAPHLVERRDGPAFEERPGKIIGRYKLLQQIGEGGCGIVYMAEQEIPVRRRVALKIIKLGMDTKSVIARFEAERQALALMDHPNIARVLDAGATDTGRPYFVMELVHGVKITEYCDQNQLSVRERLKIFIQVCQGIQHAHQKGIIHRDIKPSNILVTMHDGVPVSKVIDFGIAKATEQRLTDKTLFTSYAQLIGTPAYMSPEQMELSGLNLDTRSDIYCLGVVLYELLTGRTPFDTAELLKGGIDEMRRTLQEREPSNPSVKLRTLSGEELTKTAAQRQAEPRRFPSHLRGDLDRIVMKCLEKNRNRRYENASAVAADIQRHLNNEPVLARSPSQWYRFQKTVQRNRVVFFSSTAIVAALLLGSIISTRLFFEERKARTSETRLRQEAEAREKASYLALLVTQRRFEEADKLLADIPLNKPSVEVAAELRALGDWHAENGRWPQAAQRLGSVIKVDQLDGPEVMATDKLKLAVALLKAGERQDYEQLRQSAVASFTPASDVTAYLILKTALLLPPPSQMLGSLDSSAEVFAAKFPTKTDLRPNPPHWAQWSEALALLEYRRGNFSDALMWCDRCQNYPLCDAPMISTTMMIKGLAHWRRQNYSEAILNWSDGYELVQAKSRQGLDAGTPPSPVFPEITAPEYLDGSWYDWVISGFLMDEWNELMVQADQDFDSISKSTLVPKKADLARALGEWHAIQGDWGSARRRFGYVEHANSSDPQQLVALDYFNDGITMLEMGDEAGFLRLREEAIARFKDNSDRVADERILEVSLLRPISGTSFTNLEPLAQVLAHKLADAD